MSNRIVAAHEFAMAAHAGQKRKFVDLDYTVHLEETAQLLWEFTDGKAGHDLYVAAILHDTVEDTDTTLKEIGRHFGGNVMNLVGELTIDEEAKKNEGKKVYLARKLNEMSDNAFLIKLCDRLSNVLGLDNNRIPDSFVKWYIKETQYLLDHIERNFGEIEQSIIDRIQYSILETKLERNF